jgi:hypothetical protein
MKKDPEAVESRAHSRQRFFHCLSLGLGAAALVSTVLTFLEMKSLLAVPGEDPG